VIEQAQVTAFRAVNQELIAMYTEAKDVGRRTKRGAPILVVAGQQLPV